MSALTDDAAERVASLFTSSPKGGPTLPLELALIDAASNPSAPGAELGGYTRPELDLEFKDGKLANKSAVKVSDAQGVAGGYEVYDADGVRWWGGPLVDSDGRGTAITLTSGFSVEFGAGSIVLELA